MRAPFQPRCSPLPRRCATEPLPVDFTLAVWNVHKLPLETALDHCGLPRVDIWALQEAAWPGLTPLAVDGVMAPNLRTRNAHYGVWTGSRFCVQPMMQLLTKRRELRLLTRKAALLSAHPLADGRTLWLLNVHMLLTRSVHVFEEELSRMMAPLSAHAGPLIVAGDFNTWSRRRLAVLQRKLGGLGLQAASPQPAWRIRAHRGRALDHLFYRGLMLTRAQVLETPCSDHAPILADFRTDCPLEGGVRRR